MKQCVWIVLLASVLAVEGSAFTGKEYWGVQTRKVPVADYPELSHLDPSNMVSLVTLVNPGATGEAEGLRQGDVIVSAFGKSAVEFDFTIISGLYASSPEGATLRAGDIIPVEVLRTGDENLSQRRRGAEDAERETNLNQDSSLRLRASARENGERTIIPLSLRVSRYYDTEIIPYADPAITAPFKDFVSENWKAALPLMESSGDVPVADKKSIDGDGDVAATLMDDFHDLTNRLAKTDFYTDPYRLPLVRYVMRNPLMIEPLTRELIRNVKGTIQSPVMAAYAAMTGDFASFPDMDEPPPFEYGDLNTHLDYIEAVLKRCAELNQKAFADITPEEQAFVLRYRDEFLDSFIANKILSYERDTGKTRRALEIFRILNKIDMAWLYTQYALATALVDEKFTDSLLASLEGRDIAVPVVARRDTPYGSIVIGGTGNDTYEEDIAVLYELGGNDQYFNNQGASVPGKIPTSVFVDFGGDDAYESTDTLTQGAGNFGVGILVKKGGNATTFTGIRLVQGAAFGGIGALFSHDGNDKEGVRGQGLGVSERTASGGNNIFRGIHCSQAVAFFGAAILVNYAGNNRYESHQIAQAVGSVKGVAILADMKGNSSFYCKGDRQTSYRTRGHFDGWGQGMGFGVRPYASGGIGILYLGGGKNRLEGGTFVQGGGYYYGLGILYSDGDEDDVYIGTRYAQGFGCHQAAGAFIDAGGNDTYHTRYGVGHGLAWDESVGLFIDEAGDDTYTGGGFSLGASAMNGLALFHDKGGTDRFLSCRAATQNGNQYHGGTSLSIFLKDGNRDSAYNGRSPGTTVVEPEHSIFIDR